MGRRKQPFSHTTRLPLRRIELAESGPPVPAEEVERLAQAIERQGLLHPVLVTNGAGNGQAGGGEVYTLLVGRRRLLAARALGWEEMECILLGAEFARETAVIAALRNGAPEPWELADTLHSLKQRCRWTQTQLGVAIGKNRDFVANYLALSNISPEVRAFLREDPRGKSLSARHLRFIGRSPRRSQLKTAREILAGGLSTKLLEQRQKERPKNRQYFKVRGLRQPKTRNAGRNQREWRRYYRQINTDLRRLQKMEEKETQRTEETIRTARQQLRDIRREARTKRHALQKELRRAARKIGTGA